MGSHLLELLPKCDILMAARDCQGSWLGIPSTMLALVDEVISNPPLRLWVIRDWVEPATKRDHVRYAPKADKSPNRSEMTRWARSGRVCAATV
jgi:hypothetical protein